MTVTMTQPEAQEPNAASTTTTSITVQPPPGPNLTLPTASNPRPPTNLPAFNDAMAVRQKVFVDEQGVAPESEIDEDDARSWQWVLYLHSWCRDNDNTETGDKIGTTTATATATEAEAETEKKTELKFPIAVLRLVPPPHEPHSNLLDQNQDQTTTKYDLHHEPHIKLTRIAVLPEHRKKGHARTLIETALSWASGQQGKKEIDGAYEGVAGRKAIAISTGADSRTQGWTGLTLIHAQVSVERMYQRLGYETDESLGKWMEEGIEHVGMWRRVDLGT